MNELQCFRDQVEGLPCKIKEAHMVGELLDSVKNFQVEAQGALGEETPDSEKLQRLLDLGTTLDVELPEVPSLKQVRDLSDSVVVSKVNLAPSKGPAYSCSGNCCPRHPSLLV